MKTRIIGASALCVAFAASGALAQDFCSNAQHSGDKVTISSNQVGKIGDIGYELWDENGSGGNATFYSDGSMDCNITSAKDYLCRAGLSLGSDKTYKELGGDMIAEFKLIKNSGQNVQYSYIGVYGWMEGVPGTPSNLVEYYVIDNTLSQSMPGDWIGNEKKGTIQVDGGTYTVYRHTRTGAAIKTNGNATFYQYFSVRTSPRDCGSINISEHMRQWEKMGLTMGKLYEAKVLGEAGNTSSNVTGGKMDFPHAKVYISKGDQQESSSSEAPSSSSEAPKSSSDAKSSSSVGPASSSDAQSSSSVGPASSSDALSSSDVVESSSSGLALPAEMKVFRMSGTAQVFDMQGKFLGTVELKSGASLKEIVVNKFGKSGMYLLKQGAAVKVVSAEKR
jgi:Cobalamin biosynthesis protein CobN and related Mg-chelatases